MTAVVVATRLEAWAAHRRLPSEVGLHRVGVGLKSGRPPRSCPRLLVCGLAGALSEHLPAGSVVVPDMVGLPNGERYRCEVELTASLRGAARRLGWEPCAEPLLTLPHLTTGEVRRHWGAAGFAAVDMESGWLLRAGYTAAVVRVVLDTPGEELSPLWESPLRAAARPRLWPELVRLALTGPALALRAASVAAAVADRRHCSVRRITDA